MMLSRPQHASSIGAPVSNRRIAVLLVILVLGISAGVMDHWSRESTKNAWVIEDAREQRSRHFAQIVRLTIAKAATLASDYSCWDEMVDFVARPDPLWARENLDVGLGTFEATHYWVFDEHRREVFAGAVHDAQWKGAMPEDLALLTAAVAKDKHAQSFVHVAGSVLEIHAAPVHRSADSHRAGERFGYLVIGRLWDRGFLEGLEAMTDSELAWSFDAGRSGWPAHDADGRLQVEYPFTELSGKPIALLAARFPSSLVRQLNQSVLRATMLTVTCATFLIFVITFFLLRWISRPLRLISRSLAGSNSSHLGGLLEEKGEFGDVARLIDQSFTQRARLEQEIDLRLRLEQELKVARDEALASMHQKSRFLAILSHEIRNPLTGIQGMAEHLAQTRLHAEQADGVGAIKQSCAALLAIVNDVLEMSRIDAGQVETEAVNFDLREVIEEILEIFAVRAQEVGLELMSSIPARFPHLLCGDPLRIRQIVTNLVSNALKFTEAGQVLVEAAIVEKSQSLVVIRVRVRDTGIGIDPQRHATIFEEFKQSEKSIARRFGGTGLGLSICKRLVELMNGRIGVDSVPREGSTFWFELPLTLVSDSTEDRRDGGGFRDLQVVVVAANATLRGSLRQQLEDLGCKVVEKESAAALGELDALRDAQVLLVDDKAMAEVEAVLAARGRIGSARLVEMSPRISAHRPRAAERRRILKPVRLRALVDLLHEVLDSAPALSDAAPAEVVEHQGKRVLLTEDEMIHRRVVTRMLERMGCEVKTASNGRAAVHLVLSERFDLVLMDCHLPEIDGFEATRMIRSRGHALPVVALTASLDEETRQRCLESGMDQVLLKPVSMEVLRRVLVECVVAS